MSVPCIFASFHQKRRRGGGREAEEEANGQEAGLTARSGDKQQGGGVMEKKEGWGCGRGQYQCGEHMTDALGLLLNGFPVGRS